MVVLIIIVGFLLFVNYVCALTALLFNEFEKKREVKLALIPFGYWVIEFMKKYKSLA